MNGLPAQGNLLACLPVPTYRDSDFYRVFVPFTAAGQQGIFTTSLVFIPNFLLVSVYP